MAEIISLTISLDVWKPRIWRRIWAKDNTRLDKISEILYTSMGWSGYHLSEIRTKLHSYGNIDIDDPIEEWLDWRKFRLKDLIKDNITQFKFLYDFGDSWQMMVKLKKEQKLNPQAPYPVCVNGENAAPPEDVGSYPGYNRFIKIMNNTKDPEYQDMKEWWGEDSFDPYHFSVDEVNESFSNL